MLRVQRLVSELESSTDSDVLLKAVFKAVNEAAKEEAIGTVRMGLYSLAAAQTSASSDVLAAFVSSPFNEHVSVVEEAVVVAMNCRSPTVGLVEALMQQADSHNDETVRFNSILALGGLAEKVDGETRNLLAKYLVALFKSSLPKEIVLAAVGNAGDAINFYDIKDFLMAGVSSVDSDVRAHALTALRKRRVSGNSGDVSLISQMISVGQKDASEQVRIAAQKVAQRLSVVANDLTESVMPYNVSYTKTKEIGGSTAGLKAELELFAGSNFDCHHPTFNYEALARAEVTVRLFDSTHSAALAEIVYGKVNMAPLADRILVTVWDNVIYSKPLEAYDCRHHVKDIFQTTPGVSYSWVFFISVIPLEVKVGASLNFKMQWGWELCDGDLSAKVDLIPNAVVSVHGSAQINLLIIAAGVEITGSLNSQLIPEAHVTGSMCSVGFKATHRMSPANVDVNAFAKVWKCFLWFFDCKLKTNHVYNVFHWGLPASETLLFEKDWPIVKAN
ncbi:hypothetical protein GEMRC1_004492 [Eukaryota sp. GEM-RC1]